MDVIRLIGVKTHNLKNFNLTLRHGQFYVITGVSGSGKSSLAFDTLYAEGQRRYVESLSTYARQFLERMERPDVESVQGILPALSIESKNVVTSARSTVGTQTEINDYLRILFARIGRTFCPDCSVEVTPNQPENIATLLLREHPSQEISVLFKINWGYSGKKYLREFLPELERQGFTEFWDNGKVISLEDLTKKKKRDVLFVCLDQIQVESKNRRRLMDSIEQANRYGRGEVQIAIRNRLLHFSEGMRCFSCGRAFKEPLPNLFSFNSPLGACPKCQGFGRIITLDWDLIVPDSRKSIQDGAVEPWTKPSAEREFKQLLKFCGCNGIPTTKPWKDLSDKHQQMILAGKGGGDYFSVQDYFDYLEKKTYKMHVRIFLAKYRAYVPCPDCRETRLQPEALNVKVWGKNIFEFQQMSLDRLYFFLEQVSLTVAEKERVEPVFLEIRRRVRFLKEVGLGYLSLNRLSRTLSGGEVQRIRLAASLGSALVDTLYVLDEPSVGLHERDNYLLIRLLKELRDLGNTVVVVEHDRMMIEAADQVIDLGPYGGKKGGKLIFHGNLSELKACKDSITGQYLAGARTVGGHTRPVSSVSRGQLHIRGASQHNLKKIDVDIPLGRLVLITGISGSGKSTFLYEILYRHYLRFRGRPVQNLGKVQAVRGYEAIEEMVLVDQTPIGRTPRSNPATYIKAYEEIRKMFAATIQAKREGFGAGHFSFNVDGGRCPVCKGDGRMKVEMHFLADVFVPCESCHGKRFRPGILEIQYQKKSIDDVLAMTVDEVIDFFQEEKVLVNKLNLLKKVGLGYLQLGQSATTLSGGEAQRLKLASELSEASAKHIMYLFDEPTIGLHYDDIHFLMKAFNKLLERGHSIIVIEHNMEVIRAADYIIDLGPEGGDKGGEVLYSGSLEGILKCSNSRTGQCLEKYLRKVYPPTQKSMGVNPGMNALDGSSEALP